MTTILERLRTKTESIRGRYREMVLAIAAGEDFDDQTAEQILSATALTCDDVERDIERFKERQTWLEQYQAGVIAKKEKDAIYTERQDLHASLAKELEEASKRIRNEYQQKLFDVQTREQKAEQAVVAGDAALSRLVRNAPDELRKEIGESYERAVDMNHPNPHYQYEQLAQSCPALLQAWPNGCETLI